MKGLGAAVVRSSPQQLDAIESVAWAPSELPLGVASLPSGLLRPGEPRGGAMPSGR